MRIVIEIDEAGLRSPQVQIPTAQAAGQTLAYSETGGALSAGSAPITLGQAPTPVTEGDVVPTMAPFGVSAGPAPL